MAELDRVQLTADEYRALPETTERMELIEGEVIVAPAPRDKHQEAVGKIYLFLAGLKLGGALRLAPSDVYLDHVNALQPDVFWVSEQNPICKLGDDDYWYGPPDLVVEVLSPSTEAKDRDVKFRLYEKHSVRELWLVQPASPFIEVFTLTDGTFARLGLYQPGATFTSPALNNTIIPVKTLFED